MHVYVYHHYVKYPKTTTYPVYGTQSEKQEVIDETIDGVEERRSDAMGKMYVVRSFVVHRYTVHDTTRRLRTICGCEWDSTKGTSRSKRE